MKPVNDRIVQYPNRYQLVNVETGEVLGTYDFVEVTGTVQQAGTEIDKELFDSIQADLNTKADQDGTYTDLTAGKSNALTTATMTASDDLNNFYGEDYWGKMFYCGGGEEPSHSPSGVSGGSVFIYRNGTGSTVQEYTSNVARSGSNLPTKWIRARAYNGTWNAWKEVATSTGDYANMSVGEATKAAQDSDGNVINTTYATKAETKAKYTKPVSGIPETDLAADVQTSLGKADSAYQKPSTGIPKADLSEEVQNALETAVQGAPDATTTVKGIMTLGADGGAARYGEKSDVGLENVDNVKQYSASNPPPYPVVTNGSYPKMTVGKATNADNATNAEKLGNKAASEYALKSDIKTRIYSTKKRVYPHKWEPKSWNGFSNISGYNIWTDGENIYYSNDTKQYVLNRETSTWEPKTWNGLTAFYGEDIWTDGNDIYYSYGANQYVFNRETSTWEPKYWYGLTSFDGHDIWTDGENIYYSYLTEQYVLKLSENFILYWEPKTWNGLTSFVNNKIWTDGYDIYYVESKGVSTGVKDYYVLNRETSTWELKTLNGLDAFYYNSIWTDGENIYYSYDAHHVVFNREASTWEPKTWNGLTRFYGEYIWTDGENIYYSRNTDQYKLTKLPPTTQTTLRR